MSEHTERPERTTDTTTAATATAATETTGGGNGGGPAGGPAGGPEPETLPFFGTTWLGHDGVYGLRRVGAAVGSLAAAVAACFVLNFAYEGLAIAGVGGFVDVLLVVMFAVCSALAFRQTWAGFSRRPVDPDRDASLRSLKMIGFVGSLLAYFVRSLTEAPGESLRRREYETAVTEYERRRTARTGNPAARRAGKGRKPKRR
ncbi:hypothetical protein ACIO1C_26185 [Streptomyces sp. NPDC087420]|uniref:hypothetical protein n=1 Tax=Streptomyces sp. NPDC087420 TaxID=3365785 RepID=UPI003839272B